MPNTVQIIGKKNKAKDKNNKALVRLCVDANIQNAFWSVEDFQKARTFKRTNLSRQQLADLEREDSEISEQILHLNMQTFNMREEARRGLFSPPTVFVTSCEHTDNGAINGEETDNEPDNIELQAASLQSKKNATSNKLKNKHDKMTKQAEEDLEFDPEKPGCSSWTPKFK